MNVLSYLFKRVINIKRDRCAPELKSVHGDGISLSGIGSFASYIIPNTKELKISFEFRSADANGHLLQLPLLVGSGFLSLQLENYKLSLSLNENQKETWSEELSCQKKTANEWNKVILILSSGHKPAFECNSESREVNMINDRNMELSGLANFGNSLKIGRFSSPIPTEICFQAITIDDTPMKVGDIMLSSKLQLSCPSAINIFDTPVPSPTSPHPASVRKPIRMVIDEGQRKNFKDLIPVLFHGEVLEFVITQQPLYGNILDSSNENIEEFSSANNLVTYYQNDGSEHNFDRFSFRDRENTIEYLVNVTVNLINDPPVFANINGPFKPIEGYSNLITNEYISLSDDDTDSANVKVHILGRYKSPSTIEHTYLFNKNNPTEEISGFRLSELENNEIYLYQSHGEERYRLIFKAIDGSKTSNMHILYTQPTKLKAKRKTNELIPVRQGSQVILNKRHLEYITNAPTSSNITINYEVMEIPENGDLMFFSQEDGEWYPAEKFTQMDINKGHVKYVQDVMKKEEKKDSILLEMKIPGSNVTHSTKLEFDIIKVIFELSTDRIIVQDEPQIESHKLDFSISSSMLGDDPTDEVDTKNIKFSFPEELQFGSLFQKEENSFESPVSPDQWFMLDNLSQIVFLLKIKEEIQFQTSEELRIKLRLRDGDEAQLELLITYNPNPEKVFVINTGIEADEGGKTLIKKENLFASNLRDDRIEIELTEGPKHGSLRLINFNNEPVLNITRIKIDDIEQQRLFYDHDDSESKKDEFKFILRNIDATDQIPDIQNSGLSGEMNFEIKILLKNDNAPVRVNDNVLTVVTNGMKIISKKDLWFHDKDVNFNDKDIIITRRGINNGDIINATTEEVLFEFKQEAIQKKQIAFRHR